MLVVGWVTPGLAEVGDGREKPPILAPGLAGAGSKVHELGLLDVAPARPRGAKATRATGTWGGMWGEPGLLQSAVVRLTSWRLD